MENAQRCQMLLRHCSLRKENDGNTSPSSLGSAHCKERVEVSSHRHNDTRGSKERYNQPRYANVRFNYNHVFNNGHKSRHRKMMQEHRALFIKGGIQSGARRTWTIGAKTGDISVIIELV